jgi:hypothetical protein
MLATKTRKNTLKPKPTISKSTLSRYTFTLSATPDFSELMDYFDQRLKGLNRGEVVKLALIELRQSLSSKDKRMNSPVNLTEEEEESLKLAMKSPKSKPMNSEEMMNWLED